MPLVATGGGHDGGAARREQLEGVVVSAQVVEQVGGVQLEGSPRQRLREDVRGVDVAGGW